MPTVTKPAPLAFLASTARVHARDGAFGLVHIEHPPGDMPPLHVHHNEDEGFYLLEGAITLFLPGESVELEPGDFFLAPRGVPHAYEAGPEGAATLVHSAPDGFARFVEVVAALEEVTPEILTRVAADHGIEVLGPPGARP
jgi:quercetin dioxygenase-like cupin family protein